MRNAAIRFRGKVFFAEYHADAMRDCLEYPEWPESWDELAGIMDDGKEPLEFGREGPGKTFHPMPPLDQEVRRDWYKLD